MSRPKVNKNRIMAFVSALVMVYTLVVPSVEVSAADGGNDFINNAEPYMVDANGDGVITYEESFFLVHTSALLTVFGNVFSFNISEAVQESVAYNNFTLNATADTVLGYITETGEFVSADEYTSLLESIREELVESCGYWYPKVYSIEDLISYANERYKEGVLPDNHYTYFYNYLNNGTDYTGWFGYFNENNYMYMYNVNSNGEKPLVSPSNSFYLGYIETSDSSYSVNYYKYIPFCQVTNMFSQGTKGTPECYYTYDPVRYPWTYFTVNIARPVFYGLSDYLEFVGGTSSVYVGGSSDFQKELSVDKLNSVDWNKLNSTLYTSVVDAIVSSQSSSTSDIQSTIDEKAAEIEEYLSSIDESLKDDDGDSWLEKIHNLLEKWLPKIFEKDTSVDVDVNVSPEEEEEENNKINDFESNSDNQSSTLDELNEQNKVDKIDVDGASSSVDSHIDMESVGQYGTLLTSITSHEKVLALLLGSLSISLIAYVLFGKR